MTFAPPKLHFKGGAWTNAEDQVLQAALAQYGLRDWERVASMLTKKTAAQCRDRWENYLDPRLSLQEQWTAAEEEKLVELQGLFPNQWRLIGTQLAKASAEHRIRPPWLCEEHYQELRDQFDYSKQQQQQQQQAAGETKMTMEEFMAARRRRRAPYRAHEEKAARADTIDGERFEKEMVEMAVSRLANQDQKKGMRKERQRQLEEASFLAKLENNREGVESGTLSARQAKRMRKAVEEDRHGAPKLHDQITEEEGEEEGEVSSGKARKRIEGPSTSGFTALDINEEEQRAGTARRQRVLLRDLSAQQRAIAENERNNSNSAGGAGSSSGQSGVNLALLDRVAGTSTGSVSKVAAIEDTRKAKALTWAQMAMPCESVEDIFAALPAVTENARPEEEQTTTTSKVEAVHTSLEEQEAREEVSVPERAESSEAAHEPSRVSSVHDEEEGEEAEHVLSMGHEEEHEEVHIAQPSPAPYTASAVAGGDDDHEAPVNATKSALAQARQLVAAELAHHSHMSEQGKHVDQDDDGAVSAEAVAEARARVERFIAQGGIDDLTEAKGVTQTQQQLASSSSSSSTTVASKEALHALEQSVSTAVATLNDELRDWSQKLERLVAICFTDPNDLFLRAYVQDGRLITSRSQAAEDAGTSDTSEAAAQYVSMDYLWSYWHNKLAECAAELRFLTELRAEEQAAMREELSALRSTLSELQSRERIMQEQYRERQLAGEL